MVSIDLLLTGFEILIFVPSFNLLCETNKLLSKLIEDWFSIKAKPFAVNVKLFLLLCILLVHDAKKKK